MNKSDMIRMLELSSIAYSDNQPSCGCSETLSIKSDITDTECFIRKRKDLIIISFRGTDSKTNWKYNFRFCKKIIPYDNFSSKIRVHSGFLSTYKSVRKKIHEKIPESACKIIITGHSLGAAAAILCAVDLQYNFRNKDIEVYVYGCPRVGNKYFAKSYNKRVFKTLSFINGNDVVTKLPPAFLGYRHAGIPIHTGPLRFPFIISFSEHKTQNYFKNLWKTTC
jgi:predicted lipase